MTLRTGEDILIWRRRLWIALHGGIVLEEALDLSSDRILNEWIYRTPNPNFIRESGLLGEDMHMKIWVCTRLASKHCPSFFEQPTPFPHVPLFLLHLHHTLQQSACEFFARRTFLVFKNHNTALAVQVAAFFIVVFFFNDDSELEKKKSRLYYCAIQGVLLDVKTTEVHRKYTRHLRGRY